MSILRANVAQEFKSVDLNLCFLSQILHGFVLDRDRQQIFVFVCLFAMFLILWWFFKNQLNFSIYHPFIFLKVTFFLLENWFSFILQFLSYYFESLQHLRVSSYIFFFYYFPLVLNFSHLSFFFESHSNVFKIIFFLLSCSQIQIDQHIYVHIKMSFMV